jgi:predicted methyltransferase
MLNKNVMLLSISLLSLAAPAAQSNQVSLSDIVAGEHRLTSNVNRDKYRHPIDTLNFIGIKPNMTVIEVWPGKGWYSEILAPYLKQGSGKLIAAGFPQNEGPKWRQSMAHDYQQWLRSSPEIYDEVGVVELGPPSYWNLGPDNSVDAVVTFRNVHNWLKGGYQAEMFTSFFKVLKPGGVLGVTDHRAPENMDLATMKKSGYVSESLVIAYAKQAGFILEETSEVNANPLDNKDYIKGVWTLPPSLRLGDENKQKYLTIGESDRMTLRFRKPK